jgi:DNA-binding HxlR family transcriptional regulator
MAGQREKLQLRCRIAVAGIGVYNFAYPMMAKSGISDTAIKIVRLPMNRKISSSNFDNETYLDNRCSLNYGLRVISGRWKAELLLTIRRLDDSARFNELGRELEQITDTMLTRQLNQLIAAKLIERDSSGQYALNDRGRNLCEILDQLCEWSIEAREAWKIEG